MPQVKCSVSNCDYWSTDNRCSADLIMIDIDKHAGADYKAEFAGEVYDTEHQDHAEHAKETCCHTFKPKQA